MIQIARDRDMMPESLFTEVEISQQRAYNGVVFPTVLSPNPTNPFHLTQAIQAHKPWLESILHQKGAILFRGFPVTSASDFNDVVEAFGFDDMPYLGGGAIRNSVVGRVLTANESPPHQKIPFHNEMAYLPEYPSKLFFFCEVEPESGGETPIVLSHIVYERIKESYPEFVERLEEHGLLYTKVWGEEDNLSSAIGRGWKSKFYTDDKSVAEERAAKLGMKVEWLSDGMKTILGPAPGIKFDQTRQRKSWFNSMLNAYILSLDDAPNDPVMAVTFGDGKPLPAHIVYDCMKILDEESVAFPWQKGDILLLDNLAVLHSRRPFNPPRRILVSLCK